jgi:hypothetical protein
MKQLINQPGEGPHIHLQELSRPLAYLRRLPAAWSRAGRTGNTRSTGSPFLDKSRLRALLQDRLLKQLGNYSVWAETVYA